MGLFRNSVLNQSKSRLAGEVYVFPSPSITIIVCAILIWTVFLSIWLLSSYYTKFESVSGWLEPNTGVLKVTSSSEDGYIERIYVKEGEHVLKGQVLVSISTNSKLKNGKSVLNEFSKELESKKSVLLKRKKSNEQLYEAKIVRTEQQILSSNIELDQVNKQLNTILNINNILKKESNKYNKISSNSFMSESEYNRIEENKLVRESEWLEVNQTKANLNNQILQLKNYLPVLKMERDALSLEIEGELIDIKKELLKLESETSYSITANESGIISNIVISDGQHSEAHSFMMNLTPSKSILIAQLIVPPNAIGFIKKGQLVNLRYDSYPYQKYGTFKGTIINISETIFLPDEIQFSPFVINRPSFIVKVELSKDIAFNNSIYLKAGMTFSAKVELEKKRIYEWLLDPLLALKKAI